MRISPTSLLPLIVNLKAKRLVEGEPVVPVGNAPRVMMQQQVELGVGGLSRGSTTTEAEEHIATVGNTPHVMVHPQE